MSVVKKPVKKTIKKKVKKKVKYKNYPLSDMGSARLFADLFSDRVRWDTTTDKWLAWDGKRWNSANGNIDVIYLSRKVAAYWKDKLDELKEDISAYLDGKPSLTDEEKKEIARLERIQEATRKWWKRTSSAYGVQAMLYFVKSEKRIAVSHEALDTDVYLLNVQNGTVDLRTGELRDHDPDDLITKLAPVVYDPKATLKLWDTVLDTATDGNKFMKNFLQAAVGYTLTGDTSEEVIFFVSGPTSTMKTTFIEPIKLVLGDYAKTSDFNTFIKRKQGSEAVARNDVARLCGARMVTTSEIDESKELDENLLKRGSGGNTITARYLYKEAFEFIPQFKLWMEANEDPRVKDSGDDSMWRRILRVPFNHHIPKKQRDKNVKATLMKLDVAGSAILSWAVQGCLKWQRKGLIVPKAVKQSTEVYKESQEDLREFFDDECVFDSNAYVKVRDLRSRYEQWAKDNGTKILGPVRFNRKLKARGCRKDAKRIIINKQTRPVKCWFGVKLSA